MQIWMRANGCKWSTARFQYLTTRLRIAQNKPYDQELWNRYLATRAVRRLARG